ncbi:MAG: YkgJ family cysteine cluster protein [Candidatus Sumerlaeia bacterium]|nr:YkgJ family cysteine cluster protein [Candidatus Sumerlaeia bacterium]
MRDGFIRRALKRIALLFFQVNLRASRAVARFRGDKPFRLGGACRGCGKCCESPGIQVGRLVWYLPTLRNAFLAWHRHVNGFELIDRDIRHRVFIFKCHHFDWETRRCDSYDTRPGMCRDYPRNQLWQPNPTFLEGCGYKAIHPNASKFLESLKEEGLEGEALEKVKEKLNLLE